MNLGLGLAAADEYFKEGDRRNVRDYEQQKRAAEISTLGDRTAAERTGYQLRTGQNQQGLYLLPGQTAIKQTEQQTAGIQANIGLSNAQNDQDNLSKVQEVKNNTLQGQVLQSRADLDNLPEKIRQATVSGQLSGEGQRDLVLGTLAHYISGNDKTGALDFANRIAKVTDIMPNTNGKTFTDIAPVRGGPEGDGYNFTTSDGITRFVPAKAMQAALGKMKSGEYQFIHDNNGNVYAGNKATGTVTQTHQGDPTLAGRQHTPAEIQTMEYLVKNGVAKNTAQAWDMVRSSREKTRNSFIMDYVAKSGGLGQDPAKLSEQAGKIYDELRGSLSPAPAAPAAGGSSSNWSDWTR